MIQLILFLSLITTSAASCNRTCGKTTVPYPFGFSSSCHIQLSCNSTFNISFHGFPLQNITTDNTFMLNISTNCSCPVTSASVFFSTNYALTHRNCLLLRNCPPSVTSQCLLPTMVVSQMSFQLSSCEPKDDNLTCFFNNSGNKYLTKDEMLTKRSCGDLFTSTLFEPNVAGQNLLALGIVEIGWWMMGKCHCAANASCTRLNASEVKNGYWCKCNDGFAGDGFAEGEGCRKSKTSTCAADCKKNLATRHARSILEGIAGGASVSVCLILFCLVCCRHLKRTHQLDNINNKMFPVRDHT